MVFRTDWYVRTYPDVRHYQDHPIFHYVEIGHKLGYQPNPYFEPDYYSSRYGADLKGEEPLRHFLHAGDRGFDPSPRFDASRYLDDYPDVRALAANPLVHYLSVGMAEGRIVHRAEPGSLDADFRWIKSGDLGRDNVLLVTHSPAGRIKRHVSGYAIALRRAGFAVTLVVATDAAEPIIDPDLDEACTAIAVRQNVGFDFGAWADVLRRAPDFLKSDRLLLTNDSILGPIGGDLRDLMRRVDACRADVVGLTGFFEYADHFQSYFLVFNDRALQSDAFRSFFGSVVNLPEKSKVIYEYEIPLVPRLRAAGLSAEALFPAYVADRNPTIWHWDRLLSDGFPFLKMSLISGEEKNFAPADVRAALRKRRFDVSIADHPYDTPEQPSTRTLRDLMRRNP